MLLAAASSRKELVGGRVPRSKDRRCGRQKKYARVGEVGCAGKLRLAVFKRSYGMAIRDHERRMIWATRLGIRHSHLIIVKPSEHMRSAHAPPWVESL